MAVEAGNLAARLLAEFPRALATGQLVAYFQPAIQLSSGQVMAAEALARWEHPELGIVAPAQLAGTQLRARQTAEFTGPGRPYAGHPGALPYFAVAGSYLLLIVVGLRDVRFNPLGGVLLGAVLLTILVSMRQFAALRDNGRLAAQYAELAAVDELTGLFTRRHFMEVADGAFAHAQRFGLPLVVLMIDVDRFKQITTCTGTASGIRCWPIWPGPAVSRSGRTTSPAGTAETSLSWSSRIPPASGRADRRAADEPAGSRGRPLTGCR